MTGSGSYQRKHVLFVTPWYPVPDSPARGVFIREHARAAALFDDVAVVHLVADTTGERRLTELEQVANEPFPVIRTRYRMTKHVGWLLELTAFRRAVTHLAARGFIPDLVHAHIAPDAAAVALYSQLTGLPMILSEHWTRYLDADPNSFRGVAALRTRLALKQATEVLPHGYALEGAMRRFAPDARYTVVPNVIDCELFRPARTRPSTDTIKLIAVGLLSPQKDYPTMLRAMRELVDAQLPVWLQIIGYGDGRAELLRLIEATGLQERVELVGYLPKTEIAKRLRESHVFVHSSRFENLCVAPAEALASGIPVISTRVGGPSEYVTSETGLIVPIGDPPALAAGIRSVINDLDRFDPIRIAALVRSRFAADAVGEQLHRVYLSAPPRRQHRPALGGRRQGRRSGFPVPS